MDCDEIKDYIEAFKNSKSKRLDLSNKDIEQLPVEIGNLDWIEHINLSYNYLTELPEALFELKNLKSILLTRNQLKHLPASISKLTNLMTLDISNNKLTSLPEEIGELENLEILDASYNKLESLPLELINLLSIRKLYLEENTLHFPPQKVVKRGLYAVMHYLTHMKKKRDATRVYLQVFNMPEESRDMFEQYLNNFNNLVSNIIKHEIHFNYSYINPEDKKD
ncbi:MAG: hypothetical protein C0594_05650 [Marinilabiliales bacterium]|nr:MAG: hypothetical protein C0594_05650 [Marinilabiliales bacterium]